MKFSTDAPVGPKVAEYYGRNEDLVTGALTSGFFSRAVKLRVVRRLIGPVENATVLDLGCGRGEAVEIVRDGQAARYLGIDIVRKNVERARRAFDWGDFLVGDLLEPPASVLAEAPFDIIFLLDVLEHLPPEATMRSIRRLTAPGSRVLITMPNYLNGAGLWKLWMEVTGQYGRNTWAPFSACKPQLHERYVTSLGTVRLLRLYGFEHLSSLGFDVIGAFYPFIYGERTLRGPIARFSDAYSRLNDLAMWKLARLSRWISMYFFAGARRSE